MSNTTTNSKAGQGARIFITGASGYVGSRLTALAISQGYTVIGLSRSEANDVKLRDLGATPVRGDLKSLDVLSRESAAADVVIHLADAFGGSHFTMPYNEVLTIDAAAVKTMVTPLQGTNKPFVATSGTMVVAPDPDGRETTEDSPRDPHALTRRGEAEQNTLSWVDKGVRVIVIRLPFVYGQGGSGVELVMRTHAPSKAIMHVVTEGTTKYMSTVHVDDAARLYLLAAKHAKAGDVFNCASSTTVTIRQILEAIAQVLKLPVHDVPVDEAAAKIGEFLARFLTVSNRASGAKSMKKLSWQPVEIEILDDIISGSYAALAEDIRKSIA